MAEAEELVRKKRLRAGHRASTTRILGQVQPAITAEPLDVSKINQLKRSLEDKLRTLSVLDEEILGLMGEEAIEEEIGQADEIKERIYTARTRLDGVSLVADPTAGDSPPPTEPPVPRRTREARVKLPKISASIRWRSHQVDFVLGFLPLGNPCE